MQPSSGRCCAAWRKPNIICSRRIFSMARKQTYRSGESLYASGPGVAESDEVTPNSLRVHSWRFVGPNGP